MTKITCDKKQIDLEYLGEGNTVICYRDKVTGDVYKEFFPKRFSCSGSLIRGENQVVQIAENVDKAERENIEKAKEEFLKMEEIPAKIRESYKKDNATMVVSQKLVQTDLGELYFCPFVGGKLLKDYIEKELRGLGFIEKLKKVLSVQIKLLNDLNIYHKNGYVNFDIKEENLWCVNVDKDDHLAIRNLDFGSCLNLKDLSKIQKDYSSITLTETYYDTVSVRRLIGEKQKENIKKLDLLACFRLGLVALYAKGRKGYEKKILGYGSETRKEVDAIILREVFCKEESVLDDRKNLFSLYVVYQELNEIFKILIDESSNISCLEMQARLQKLFDFIEGKESEQTFVLRESVEIAKKYIPSEVTFIDLCFKNCLGEQVCTLAKIASTFLEESLVEGLFADVRCGEETYTVKNGENDVPLMQLYKKAKGLDGQMHYLILGDGGMGKSVSAKILNAKLLAEGIPCVLYECRSLVKEDNFKKLDKAPKDVVVIIDAYDEYRFNEKFEIENLIKSDRKVLVTCRWMGSENNFAKDPESPFKKYKIAQMQELSNERVASFLDKLGSSPDFLYSKELLKNTMFMAMLLECKGFSEDIRKTIKNEATFIQAYFYEIYKSKSLDDRINWKSECDRHCRLIGERVVNDTYLEVVDFEYANENEWFEFSDEIKNANELLASMPTLKGVAWAGYDEVFKFERLMFSNLRFPEFFVSCYLYSLMQKTKRYWGKIIPENKKSNQIKMLEYVFSLYKSAQVEICSYGSRDFYENPAKKIMQKAVYLVAQKLTEEEFWGFFKFCAKNCSFEDKNAYLTTFYLGYNQGIVKDKVEGKVENFQWQLDEDNVFYLVEIKDNGVIPSLLQLIEGYDVYTFNVKNIDIEQTEKYISKNGILIDKETKTVVLGNNKESVVIPDDVRVIGENVFRFCNKIVNLKIPANVKMISEGAFLCCDSLKNLEIEEGVEVILKNAFNGCRNLTEVKIPNSLKVGQDAFSYCKRLKKIVVPEKVDGIATWPIHHLDVEVVKTK